MIFWDTIQSSSPFADFPNKVPTARSKKKKKNSVSQNKNYNDDSIPSLTCVHINLGISIAHKGSCTI